MQAVVVTGISSGIGRSTAKALADRGVRVFGSVRRQADAERVQAEFGDRVVPLIFDVTDQTAVAQAAAEVERGLGGQTLAGLVNNAGIAVAGPLIYLETERFREQLEVNVTGPLIVTQAFAPLLGADHSRQGPPGRVVMMSSIGGRNANPFMGAYNASKFAIEGLSEALRRELIVFGIDVVIVAPGPIATPIWDRAEQEDLSPYAGTPFVEPMQKARAMMVKIGKNGPAPEKVASVILEALTAKRPKTRYRVAGSAAHDLLTAILPKRAVDNVIAGTLGMKHER